MAEPEVQEPFTFDVSSRFDELVVDMIQMRKRKGADYGDQQDTRANLFATEEFGVKPSVGVFIRMNDKMARLKSFTQKGQLLNESVVDSLRDLAVYALLAITLIEEGR